MDVTEAGTIIVSSVTVGGGTIWAWLKLSFKLKEEISLIKQKNGQMKTDFIKLETEFDKLESKVDKNKDTILDKLAEMQKDLGDFKTDIMRAILEKKK